MDGAEKIDVNEFKVEMSDQHMESYDDWDDIPTNEFGSEPSEEVSNEEESDNVENSSSSEDTQSDGEPEPKAEEVSDKTEEESDKAEPEEESEQRFEEVKIDGELQKVSIEDLKSNYSGKVAWDKRFSEIDKERKQVVAERDNLQQDISAVNKYINDLGDKMRNVSMIEGLNEIAALNNIGPHVVKQALIKELLPEINRMADLSEDQIDLEYNRADLEYQKALQERESEKMRKQQTQRELQENIDSVLSKSGISMDEYKEAESFLNSRKDEVGEINPELISEYVLFSRAESRADNILNDFDSGNYIKNEEVVNGVIDMLLRDPDFSDEEVNEILTDVLGKAKKEVAEKKIEQKQKSSQKKTQKINEVEIEEGPEDWDDILD
jgi:hypothetical protein